MGHMHKYIYIYTCRKKCVYCMYVRMSVCMHRGIYLPVCVCVALVGNGTCVRLCIYMHICMLYVYISCIYIYMHMLTPPPRTTFWAKNYLSHGPIGKGKIPSIDMNIGNGTIINTRLRVNMIMADSIGTEINMNKRISSGMNVSSNMHIDTHTIIKVDISNASTKYEQKY